MEQPRVRMSPELMAVKSSPEKAGPAWAGVVSRRMGAGEEGSEVGVPARCVCAGGAKRGNDEDQRDDDNDESGDKGGF